MTCSGCQCTSASWNLRATVQKEATVPVLRAKQAAAIFYFLCTDMAASFYAHTEVCYEICSSLYLYVPVQPQDIKDIGDFLQFSLSQLKYREKINTLYAFKIQSFVGLFEV